MTAVIAAETRVGPRIAVVVPTYREVENIPRLVERLRAVRDSGGFCIALPDDEIMAARDRIAAEEGLLLCPEGAATAAAYARARASGLIGAEETAVLWNCASGLKYPLPPVSGRIDHRAPPDWSRFG